MVRKCIQKINFIVPPHSLVHNIGMVTEQVVQIVKYDNKLQNIPIKLENIPIMKIIKE